MTPREKLLALAERLERPDGQPSAHEMMDVFTINVPLFPRKDRKAAAQAIRVFVKRHQENAHPGHFQCSCGFSASGGLRLNIDSCPTLREAAGGDDAEA